MTDLLAMQKKFPNVTDQTDFPKDYAAAFRVLYSYLMRHFRIRAALIECSMTASPLMRQYFYLQDLSSPGDDDSTQEKGPNQQRARDPHEGTAPGNIAPGQRRLRIEMVEGSPGFVRDIMWIFDRLCNQYELERLGIQTIIDEFNREYAKRPELISPFIAWQMSFLGVLSECIRQMKLFQPWAATLDDELELYKSELGDIFRNQHKHMILAQRYEVQEPLASLASPSGGRYDYPIDKPRTPINVDRMSSAVKELDFFWNALTADLKAEKQPIPARCLKVLSTAAEHVPPPWESDDAMPLLPGTQGMIRVSKKVNKVLNRLFYTPSEKSAPPEATAWNDFTHAMLTIGFAAEKLHGSAWYFTPKKADKPGIIFHEPRPGYDMAFATVREYGRRLYRTYGMTKAPFVVKK
ncbi:hypothetical protein BR93DRAFT_929047 [Coniochaeta sp. PMI_546]|nr:hypothetical protein BR93DRAFT_929047 [Coniochaeta sp. PMI_546]